MFMPTLLIFHEANQIRSKSFTAPLPFDGADYCRPAQNQFVHHYAVVFHYDTKTIWKISKFSNWKWEEGKLGEIGNI